MADNGLDHLAPWLEGYLHRLEPGERRKLTRKLAKALRDRNAKRIRDNVQPDGTPMEPRKSQRDRRGRLRKRKGRMFPKTSLAKNLRYRANDQELEVSFRPLVAGTASVHHYGLTAPVDPRIPNSIKIRFPARRLLGLSEADILLIEKDSLNLLE
jgi:phage virion morphogenesis protein